jgi:hypothetical protein
LKAIGVLPCVASEVAPPVISVIPLSRPDTAPPKWYWLPGRGSISSLRMKSWRMLSTPLAYIVMPPAVIVPPAHTRRA